jgi:hypothetical protein
MTIPDIFRFDELTWPEVAALPRETPLLLPLGSAPDLETVPASLKATQPVSIPPTGQVYKAVDNCP